VLPGTHSIKVFLFTVGGALGGTYSRTHPLEMTFSTEAGKKYTINYKYEDDKVIFFITEESTGKNIPWH
jgi:hypothetical protein